MALAQTKADFPAKAHPRPKSDDALRTIAEVASELRLEPHVLRFWESKFSRIKPLKMRGGRRYYSKSDIQTIREIKDLLYEKGYTIRGVQKLFSQKNWQPGMSDMPAIVDAAGTISDVVQVVKKAPLPANQQEQQPDWKKLNQDMQQELKKARDEISRLRQEVKILAGDLSAATGDLTQALRRKA